MMRRVVLVLVATLALPLAGCTSLAGAGAPEAVRDEAGAVVTAGSSDAFSLRRGDCLRDPAEARVADVELVPCDQEHALEVFHTFVQSGDDYTSRNTLLAQADAGCEPEFGAVMGIAYGDSALEYRALVPSSVSWRHGDRTIVCAVHDPALDSTRGSFAGAAR
ncbi:MULTISPECIES: septum formation family protein [unclassified Rathayibacter]|uniref:septum formation family protein n=1 Tax=unclassified Rathayibacter TaxID=2609250 RepID=UPI00188A5255|nr:MULTISPECIES: septum formation family protein [unclassified Rathayibacter]MBF4462708.1 septum formation family protein [Rathayibacter sp. VKM Ac-2879]MBF4504122.1 septum formation family protein [Rathayibacter sp. VKM Ac-2878]